MKKITAVILLVALLSSCFASCATPKGILDLDAYADSASATEASYTASEPWNGSTSDTSWYTANPAAEIFSLSDGADLKGFIELV